MPCGDGSAGLSASEHLAAQGIQLGPRQPRAPPSRWSGSPFVPDPDLSL